MPIKSKQNRISIKQALIWFAAILLIILGTVTFQINQSKKSEIGTPTPQSITKGAELFKTYCAACHGTMAIGQDPKRPMGGLTPENKQLAPALNGTGHSWHHSNAILLKVVTEGSLSSKSPMKGFGQKLTPDEIHDVIHYIKSLWPQEIRNRHQLTN